MDPVFQTSDPTERIKMKRSDGWLGGKRLEGSGWKEIGLVFPRFLLIFFDGFGVRSLLGMIFVIFSRLSKSKFCGFAYLGWILSHFWPRVPS